jgi:hypothetical protein
VYDGSLRLTPIGRWSRDCGTGVNRPFKAEALKPVGVSFFLSKYSRTPGEAPRPG